MSIFSGQGLADIACGGSHSACVKKDGSIYLWGDNQFGQCGLNPADHKTITSPALLELSYPESVTKGAVISLCRTDEFVRISCGTQHNLALSVDGDVWVWGKGPQLGLKEDVLCWVPTILKRFCDKNVINICSGDFHNIVIVEEGTAYRDRTPRKSESSSAVKLDKSKSAKHSPGRDSKSSRKSVSPGASANNINNLVKPQTEKENAKTARSVTDIQVVIEEADASKSKTDGNQTNQSKDILVNIDVKTKGNEGEANAQEKIDDSEDNKEAIAEVQSGSKVMNDVLTTDTSEESDMKKDHNEESLDKESLEGNDKPNVKKPDAKDTVGVDSKTSKVATSEEVEFRMKKSESSDRDLLTASIRSDTSVSSKVSRSKSFLDDTGAREFLARQFQEDDDIMPLEKPTRLLTSDGQSSLVPTPSSPGAYMLQTVSSLTSQVTSMTSKAVSNIASIPGKFRFSTSALADDDTKSSSENLDTSEVSDLEMGSSDNINLDNSMLEFSNLTISETSLTASQLSLPESETSFGSVGSLEKSQVSPKKNRSGRKSVSKESQSIRTIEARQENLRKRSLSLLTAEGMLA